MAEKLKIKRVQLSDAANPDWDELAAKLWEKCQGSDRFRGSYTYSHHQPEKVRLSQVGWDQIKQIIVEQGICAEVVNSCFGFSCSLVLYKDREEPYPGAEVEARPIFQVCSHMLPGDENCRFKEGWAEFEPLFTSPENIARLKWNKLPMPRASQHYDY